MRLIFVTALFLLTPPALAAQAPCKVGLTVSAPDVSSLSGGERNLLAIQWTRNLRSNRYRLSGGGWDGMLQAKDLLQMVMGAAVPVADSGRSPGLRYYTVRGLSREEFEAHGRVKPVHIVSVSLDRSPKRIAIVAENGKHMTSAARKIESAIISDFATTARAEVSFALLTANGPRVVLNFGSTRDDLRAAAEALAKPPQHGPKGRGVGETVIEATHLFGRAQPGDSIFLVAMHLEGERRPKFSHIQSAITSAGVRVMGYQLGWISPPGQLQAEYACSDPSSIFGCEDTIPRTEWDQMIRLCGVSGGESFFEDTEAKNYVLTNRRLKELVANSKNLYEGLAERYILELDRMGPEVSVGLVPSVLDRHPWVQVSRPEILTSCPSVGDPTGR